MRLLVLVFRRQRSTANIKLPDPDKVGQEPGHGPQIVDFDPFAGRVGVPVPDRDIDRFNPLLRPDVGVARAARFFIRDRPPVRGHRRFQFFDERVFFVVAVAAAGKRALEGELCPAPPPDCPLESAVHNVDLRNSALL